MRLLSGVIHELDCVIYCTAAVYQQVHLVDLNDVKNESGSHQWYDNLPFRVPLLLPY